MAFIKKIAESFNPPYIRDPLTIGVAVVGFSAETAIFWVLPNEQATSPEDQMYSQKTNEGAELQ